MSNRHLSRSIVLQSLFEWDVRGYSDADIEAVVDRNVDEFAPGAADRSFPISLAKRVLEHKSALDTVIEKAAPEWPLSQISLVDRNVLRIGLYELIYADKSEVPAKVAINEAIELAKSFGGESSGKFVNGVLGTVYKEMGEPGKDEVSRKKRKDDSVIDITKLPVEKKAGALVYAIDDSRIFIALVHDVFGYWTMPKGTVEQGETEEEAAVREVHEEIGVPVEIIEKLGENEYTASHPQRGKYRKRVVYYIAKSDKGDLKLEDEKGGLDDVRWFAAEELEELAMYDDMVPIIAKGISRIAELNK